MRFERMPGSNPGKQPESGGAITPEAIEELHRASKELQERLDIGAFTKNHPDANPSEIRLGSADDIQGVLAQIQPPNQGIVDEEETLQ